MYRLASRSVITAVVIAVVTTACSGGSSSSTAAELNFAVGHIGNVGSPIYEGVEAMTAALGEGANISHGHSGALGNEGALLEAVQVDALEMAIITNPNLVGLNASWGILDAPYMWRDFEHFRKGVDSDRIRTLYADSQQAYGIAVLDFWHGGMRTVYGNERIDSIDGMRGLTIRTLVSPVFLDTFQAMGAIPTAVAWPEVYTSLELGTVSAAETSLPFVIDARHYEVSDYVVITNHSLTAFAVVVNADWWAGLSEASRGALSAAVSAGTAVNDRALLEAEEDARAFLVGEGLEILEPDLEPFRAIARQQYPEALDAGLIEFVQSIG